MTKPVSGGPPDFKNWLLSLSELDTDLDAPRNGRTGLRCHNVTITSCPSGAASMDLDERISIAPNIRGSKPCIKGTRITVYDILEYLAGSMSEGELLQDFPDLSREDIRAALAFAATHERILASSPTA